MYNNYYKCHVDSVYEVDDKELKKFWSIGVHVVKLFLQDFQIKKEMQRIAKPYDNVKWTLKDVKLTIPSNTVIYSPSFYKVDTKFKLLETMPEEIKPFWLLNVTDKNNFQGPGFIAHYDFNNSQGTFIKVLIQEKQEYINLLIDVIKNRVVWCGVVSPTDKLQCNPHTICTEILKNFDSQLLMTLKTVKVYPYFEPTLLHNDQDIKLPSPKTDDDVIILNFPKKYTVKIYFETNTTHLEWSKDVIKSNGKVTGISIETPDLFLKSFDQNRYLIKFNKKKPSNTTINEYWNIAWKVATKYLKTVSTIPKKPLFYVAKKDNELLSDYSDEFYELCKAL